MFFKRCKVLAEPSHLLLALRLCLLCGAAESLFDRGTGSRAIEGPLGPFQKLLVDFDGRALDHAYIVRRISVHINDSDAILSELGGASRPLPRQNRPRPRLVDRHLGDEFVQRVEPLVGAEKIPERCGQVVATAVSGTERG